ncbi:RNA polymerase sigma factor [Alicyclobacillus fodiniaquatilis]|uniref:RNA polymerase sigma factor n=1 Tax=Alicyclobacillus fodiniaquatilis TaxID=1661150 RepID=A0ABW4JM40_9BACL
MMQHEQPDAARKAAFDNLFEALHESVFAYLLARTGQRETARDLMQDVFLRAWRTPDGWLGQSDAARRYWLFTVAKHVVIDYFRRRSVQTAAFSRLQSDISAPAAPAAEERIVNEEMWRDVHQAVMELPDDLRLPLMMQTVGGMTSRDIQEALGIPAGTVRYRLTVARRQLRSKLQLGEAASGGEGQ